MLLPFSIFAQNSVSLSWDPSPDPNVVGYNIYYGPSSEGFASEVSAGNVTNFEISGLAQGVTYYFAATAYDSSGDESEFSNEASYTVPVTIVPTASLQKGSYGGLFYESNGVTLQTAGAFNLSVTANGKYSGFLQMSSTRLPFSGQFGSLCQTTNTIQRKSTSPLVVSFTLNPSNQVVGVVSGGAWIANLYGERMGLHVTTNSPPYAGKYTFVIQGNTSPSSSLGNGFGALTLSTAGTVHLVGTLADGTKLSQGTTVSIFGKWPLYVPLYSGQGLAMSWVSFTDSKDYQLESGLTWIKPASAKSLLYQGGLEVEQPLVGSRYIPTATSVPRATNANLVLSGALLDSITNKILSLNFSQANGTFTGQVLDQMAGKPTTFQGALLQKVGAGYGFVLGTNLSSPVTLIP